MRSSQRRQPPSRENIEFYVYGWSRRVLYSSDEGAPPLTEEAFGLVIVTVIVVVDVPPTGTVDGLNDFDIVRGTPWAKSGGAHTATRATKSTRRRSTNIDSAPFSFLVKYKGSGCHADLRFFDRTTYLEIIPVATKQLVRVVSFTPYGNSIDVTLEWRWAPNEIGSLLPPDLLPDPRKLHTAEGSVGWDGFREWLPGHVRAK